MKGGVTLDFYLEYILTEINQLKILKPPIGGFLI
jgi:hypothetical protein